jgi:hypothetical protein
MTNEIEYKKVTLRQQDVKIVTWTEFIEYGKKDNQHLVNGMPWSFVFFGYGVTHEHDALYLIQTKEGQTLRFKPDEVLLIREDNTMFTLMSSDLFNSKLITPPTESVTRKIGVTKPFGYIFEGEFYQHLDSLEGRTMSEDNKPVAVYVESKDVDWDEFNTEFSNKFTELDRRGWIVLKHVPPMDICK